MVDVVLGRKVSNQARRKMHSKLFLYLLLPVLTFAILSAGCNKSDSEEQELPAREKYAYPKSDFSSLSVQLFSSDELLIKDPNGLRTGFDPIRGRKFDEIPQSSYGLEELPDAEGTSGPVWKELEIMQPKTGEYILIVTGIRGGTYSLEILGYNRAGEASSLVLEDVSIQKSATHEYRLRFDGEAADPNDILRLEGDHRNDGTL